GAGGPGGGCGAPPGGPPGAAAGGARDGPPAAVPDPASPAAGAEGAGAKLERRRPTLPGPRGPSTIGAEGLNCSVRNGKRCIPLAKATATCQDRALRGPSKPHSDRAIGRTSRKKSVKPSTH